MENLHRFVECLHICLKNFVIVYILPSVVSRFCQQMCGECCDPNRLTLVARVEIIKYLLNNKYYTCMDTVGFTLHR